MKKVFILFSLCLLFIAGGCSDDKEISPEDLVLTQTVWKGTLHDYERNEYTDYQILVSFSSEHGGFYDAKYLGEGENEIISDSFTYYHEGKKVHIYSTSTLTLIDGWWWITESTDKKLTLQTFPGSTYSSTITLTKVI